jgi:hypothetical protein
MDPHDTDTKYGAVPVVPGFAAMCVCVSFRWRPVFRLRGIRRASLHNRLSRRLRRSNFNFPILGAGHQLQKGVTHTHTYLLRLVRHHRHCIIGIRIMRVHERLAWLYTRRVAEPLRLYHLFRHITIPGLPPTRPPRLPWWQPFLYAYLRAVGYHGGRSQHPLARWE